MKMIKVHVALWLLLAAGGFLFGFIPEYRKNRELQARMENPQKTIDALQLQIQIAELRDTAALTFYELSQQNYGLAREHSVQYYSKLKEAIRVVQDADLKKSLEGIAGTEASVMASLAAANPSSLASWQPVFLRTFESTKNGR